MGQSVDQPDSGRALLCHPDAKPRHDHRQNPPGLIVANNRRGLDTTNKLVNFNSYFQDGPLVAYFSLQKRLGNGRKCPTNRPHVAIRTVRRGCGTNKSHVSRKEFIDVLSVQEARSKGKEYRLPGFSSIQFLSRRFRAFAHIHRGGCEAYLDVFRLRIEDLDQVPRPAPDGVAHNQELGHREGLAAYVHRNGPSFVPRPA